MFQFALSTWRAGLRGRSIQAILILGVLLMGGAYLAASFSPRQPQTVALDVGYSALRGVLILLGLFWVQDLVAHEISKKTVVMAVSYPVRRSSYLLGRYLGIVLLLLLAAFSLSLLLLVMTLFAGRGYEQAFSIHLGWPFWAGSLGLFLDAAVVAGFALLVVSFSTVAVLPLALGICFSIAAKTVGVARAYIATGADGNAALVSQMSPWIELVHWLLPDLSRLDWRAWPMYGQAPAVQTTAWGVLAAGAYLTVLLVAACAIFEKRDLN